MPILSFCSFSFAFSTHVAKLATGSPNSVSRLHLSAFLAFFALSAGLFNLTIFCCLFIWGFSLSVPSQPSTLAFLPVPDVLTSSGVFDEHGLCFSIRASIWDFSMANHFASLSFISFLYLYSFGLF